MGDPSAPAATRRLSGSTWQVAGDLAVVKRRPIDPFSGPWLWAQYASGLIVLLALCLVGGVEGTGWSWPIFVTGLLGGAVIVALNHVMLHFAWGRMVARWQPPPDRETRGRQELRKRQRFYPVLFTMMAGIAVLSAALETYWLIALTLLVVLLVIVVLPLALLPLLIARSEHAVLRDP